MKYNRFDLFLLLSFTVISCFGQEITVKDNLLNLFKNLEENQYSHAIICTPFTTKFDVLEKAAQQGTVVDVVSKKKSISEDYCKQVHNKRAVVGYHANLHDKIALTKDALGFWSARIGSANFSNGHLSNTEVVLHIPCATKMRGLTRHIMELLDKSTLSEEVPPDSFVTFPSLSLGPPTSRRNRRGSCTEEELVSCFDFKEDDDYTLVSWMADRIKVAEKRAYWISTMNLDHSIFIERIKQAVENGSTFYIIVHKDVTHLTGGHAILKLSTFAQKNSNKIVLVWKKGRDTESKIHHAKLFVRSPNSSGENGLTIVPTANFTKKGGTEHNCAVVLPHASSNPATITALSKKFSSWWELAENVPSAPMPRQSDQSKVADYVIRGIVPQQSCRYYLTSGVWGNVACTRSIENCLTSRNGSIFKIMLLKNWIKKDTSNYQDLKKLVEQNPGSIEIRSWDKGSKKKTIGGKRILTKGFTVFSRDSFQNIVLPYAVICSSNLTYAKKKPEEDLFSTDLTTVQRAIADFEQIWNGAEAIQCL